MWQDDEDNNPYGSFNPDATNPALDTSYLDQQSSPPPLHSPENEPPEFLSHPRDLSDDEEAHYSKNQSQSYVQKKGGYDSRIEQLLYENPELEIVIANATKSPDGGYIVYRIRTGDIEVARRYSEFSSLRAALVNLHPTLVIPPIPEKHSMADYAAKPRKAKEDTGMIDLRKRMLGVFLNRCRKMKDVVEDGVWWRFLDPNSSWSEVLHSHPVSSIPKSNLKAPPLDPANPTPAHSWLPVPASSAKLKSASATSESGTPTSPPSHAAMASTAAHTIPGPQLFNRFPPASQNLSEEDLDPYFINFEASTRDLEMLMQGNIEKVNRRTLEHYAKLSTDLRELGARYNGFSLSESSPTVAAAIERIGQAVDTTHLHTEELALNLGVGFAEPMRESAQFAGVVRSVLRYRVLKRVQQEMTRDELERKKTLLDSLERSELEAKRIDQYLSNSVTAQSRPRRSASSASGRINPDRPAQGRREASNEDTASIDSDFPPTHGDTVASPPSATQGTPQRDPASPPPHRKTQSGNFVTNKIFGRISHAVHGFVDVDPERTRRDQIGKTKESLVQLDQALEVSETDVKDASAGVLKDLKRLQKEKEEDLQRYMIAYARCHIDWARKNLDTWTEAREEVDKIVARLFNSLLGPFAARPLRTPSCGRAATLCGQLTVTTSSVKRRSKAADSRAALSNDSHHPALRGVVDKDEACRNNPHLPCLPLHRSSQPFSPSPPRFLPPHLHDEVKAAPLRQLRRKSTAPEGESTIPSQPSDAYANLTSQKSPVGDMSRSDQATTEPERTVSSQQFVAREHSHQPLRSSSPAVKRAAIDMGAQEREDHSSDLDMDRSSILSGETPGAVMDLTPKAKQQDTGSRHEQASSFEITTHHSSPRVFSQNPSEENASAFSDNTLPASSIVSTAATSTAPTVASADLPSIDDQVSKVTALAQKPLQDKQKGYAVSVKWLNRVRARSSLRTEIGKMDKSATEGEIGPVDNSDLAMVIEGSGQFEDENGDSYVPFKPGLQLEEDYVILPEEAWDLIVRWYGLLASSPVITRYVHNTSTGEIDNCQYELNPPIFSLLKLPSTHATTPQAIRDQSLPPVKFLASRHMPFNDWLKQAKQLVRIELSTKVRVWKVLSGLKSSAGSGIVTPTASRSASPAPGADIVASAGDHMLLDVTTFLALEKGSDRELVDVKDQTMNENYNGHSSILLAGLSRDEVIVLEEQTGGPAGGEWVSDSLKAQVIRANASKSGAAADKAMARAGASSGRSSPAPGMVTRGRQRRDGKVRGITGLGNLGNTCYMNSALQCIRSIEELTLYFLNDRYKPDLNPSNPLGYGGEVAKAYANLLSQIYSDTSSGTFSPTQFKRVIARYAPSFSGYGQQDSQEFLLFLLDGLQEDLNRIKNKPYIEKPDSTDEMVQNQTALRELADKSWEIYKARNDSVISDLFAGMYKSTVICPVCSKVSIIFDPFTNLTLQLPIENNWSKQIFYFPLRGRPIMIDVDIDKNAGFGSLKDYVAKRMGSDPARLIGAEIYKQKFYKMFDNVTTIAEHNIQGADQVGIYEVEAVPTNYGPNRQKRSGGLSLSSSPMNEIPDLGTPAADRLLIPLFHRIPKIGNSRRGYFFGPPSYIVVNRDEAKSYDEVLRKVLGNVASMTTMPILEDDGDGVSNTTTPEDSDTVVMNDDDTISSDSHVQVESVEGEDGLVDVSMREASGPAQPSIKRPESNVPSVLKHGRFIPANLQNLFEMKIYKSDIDAIPLGWSSLDEGKELVGISDRQLRRERRRSKYETVSGSTSSDEALPTRIKMDDSDDRLDQPVSESGSETDLPSPQRIFASTRHSFNRRAKNTYSKKGRKPVTPPPEEEGWLVRPGEAIVLDWNDDAHDALFEGTENETNGMRGTATWKKIDTWPDEELAARRAQSQARRKNGVTLDECLDEFGKMETLSENNSWYCPRCKEHRQADKKFELWKVPDILVMHLKRFSSNRNFRDKLELYVDYPVEGLDLSKRVLVNDEGKSMVYDLIAVDNHYGGLGGGHYTAVTQNFFNKEWYDYNDSHVSTRTAQSAIVTPNAYLLFYRRRSDHPLGGPLLTDVVTSTHSQEAEPGSVPGSREPSPSAPGEGPLGGSSLNGSSSAFRSNAAGAIRHMGGGGPAQGQGVSQEADAIEIMTSSSMEHDGLPGYSEIPTDEGIDVHDGDVQMYGPNLEPSWSFSHLGSMGAPHSQMTVVPPSSLDGEANDFYTQEDDLFAADDNASTQAEGGDRSSVEMSDRDEDFVDPPVLAPSGRRQTRALAPTPPLVDDDGNDAGDLPVAEIIVDDADQRSR